MIDRIKLETYVDGLALRLNAPDAYAVTTRFLCRCVQLVQECLPETGQAAFGVAQAYWFDGEVKVEDLVAARLRCWRYLDEKGRASCIYDDEDAAMRALICLLYPALESGETNLESINWFFDFLEEIELDSRKLTQLLEIELHRTGLPEGAGLSVES